MRPLQTTQIDSFLKRFDNFKDGEFREISIDSPTDITITLTAQDLAKDFDWVSVKLQFSGVIDASLVDNSNVSFIDMNNGISLFKDGTNFAFDIINSTCYIKSLNLKFEEKQF